MQKRLFVLFTILLVFFIVISGEADLQHIMVGALICLITTWFWKDSTPKLPSIRSFKELLVLGRSIAMLIGYVILSNIDVAKILLFSDLSSSPAFLELEPDIKTDWGRVLLATCITITPGTITIDFDPETNIFTVHALTVEMGKSLYYWRIISEIEYFEDLVQRREAHGMDSSRLHGTDSISAIKGHHRAYRN